ncbi:DeoR/GlpR family DNA-binding transcription regulator [Clostridium estertheticum]|uniref:DeoR/GlpR family DNA-binding transcription regulator n=1 Tax=Clostridium estertheticum TaxID=238834 RepID=UPI0013E944EC|nr:DeoR/GlpR family DNA-binding transcription regulator [Clostridium estertheticum]MBZ9685940.1 DeoR/GlpR family DNA-binding transcription regulator [Clostridium estertheticum]
MAVFLDERKNFILYELDNYEKVSVTQLAKKFGVTTETIRRDLDTLEAEYKLKRIHGGAIKISFDRKEPSHIQKRNVYREEKQRIGQKAASLINDNDIITIDAGTTTCEILYHVKNKRNLTILLNTVAGLNIIIDFKNKGIFDGKIIFLGGEINSDQLSCVGPISENLLKNFYVDKAFIGVGGVSLQNGLTGYDVNESNLSKKIMENSKEVIIVADHSKIGVRNFYKIADIENVNVIVSDVEAPNEWGNSLNEYGIDWIKA